MIDPLRIAACPLSSISGRAGLGSTNPRILEQVYHKTDDTRRYPEFNNVARAAIEAGDATTRAALIGRVNAYQVACPPTLDAPAENALRPPRRHLDVLDAERR